METFEIVVEASAFLVLAAVKPVNSQKTKYKVAGLRGTAVAQPSEYSQADR